MKVAIYSRVSTNDQHPENQFEQLRAYAKAVNGGIVEEYIDYASGGSNNRHNFNRMLRDADKHRFDLLLIWSLDRFSREGISNTLGYLERLKRNNVAVKSLQESWADTRDEGIGQVLISIIAWVAKEERRRIRERTKAAMKRLKDAGKPRGRPKGSKDKKRRVRSGYVNRWREVKNPPTENHTSQGKPGKDFKNDLGN